MILTKSLGALLLVPLLALGAPSVPAEERLGSVDFPVTCAPATQRLFNRGVALDSREFGSIPTAWIVGPVIARYWPLTRLATFK